MNPQITVPILIALLAFFIADEERRFLSGLIAKALSAQDRTHIRERLIELGRGSRESYENFRIYQLFLISTPIAIFLLLALMHVMEIFTAMALSIFLAVALYGFTEWRLSKLVSLRRAEIEGEFPALIEMLTLAIGAGESTSSAMKRISRRASGYLAQEFSNVIKEIESGTPFHIAMDHMSYSLNSAVIRRFVDAVIISINRGTPLIETLSHAVSEARNLERASLLTAAGKAEISMMIPVVFLILPISILFALYPSLASLELFGA